MNLDDFPTLYISFDGFLMAKSKVDGVTSYQALYRLSTEERADVASSEYFRLKTKKEWIDGRRA